MKILIVDDDAETREVLGMFLSGAGYKNVFYAEDAKNALKQFVLHMPDVVFLDVVLPDKNGIEVLKEIKSLDKAASFVIMTAYKDADRVIEAFREGALDCILKPFNFEYIKNNVLSRVVPRD